MIQDNLNTRGHEYLDFMLHNTENRADKGSVYDVIREIPDDDY